MTLDATSQHAFASSCAAVSHVQAKSSMLQDQELHQTQNFFGQPQSQPLNDLVGLPPSSSFLKAQAHGLNVTSAAAAAALATTNQYAQSGSTTSGFSGGRPLMPVQAAGSMGQRAQQASSRPSVSARPAGALFAGSASTSVRQGLYTLGPPSYTPAMGGQGGPWALSANGGSAAEVAGLQHVMLPKAKGGGQELSAQRQLLATLRSGEGASITRPSHAASPSRDILQVIMGGKKRQPAGEPGQQQHGLFEAPTRVPAATQCGPRAAALFQAKGAGPATSQGGAYRHSAPDPATAAAACIDSQVILSAQSAAMNLTHSHSMSHAHQASSSSNNNNNNNNSSADSAYYSVAYYGRAQSSFMDGSLKGGARGGGGREPELFREPAASMLRAPRSPPSPEELVLTDAQSYDHTSPSSLGLGQVPFLLPLAGPCSRRADADAPLPPPALPSALHEFMGLSAGTPRSGVGSTDTPPATASGSDPQPASQSLLASIGVELARQGIGINTAVSGGWLGELSQADLLLLTQAYEEEIMGTYPA